MQFLRSFLTLVIFSLLLPVNAAENLRLRDGVSFEHDLDKGFPIVADKMDDAALSREHPTLVFFGATGDLNTNRQAKRIVDLYKKYQSEPVKFVIVDVDHPLNAEAKQLVKTYYQGYIPSQLLFDKSGTKKWSHTGEIEQNVVAGQVEKIL